MILFSIDHTTIYQAKKDRIPSIIFDLDILFQLGNIGEVIIFEDCEQCFDNCSNYFGSSKTVFEVSKSANKSIRSS